MKEPASGGDGVRSLSSSTMSETPRAQLIHIDVDRRLGHEWDEWDGRALPNRGDYDSSPTLFFGWSAAALTAALAIGGLGLFLLGPRLALPAPCNTPGPLGRPGHRGCRPLGLVGGALPFL